MLPFSVQFQDNVPVSDQILQAVRKAMLTGQLKAGDTFPSVRVLGQELQISPTTAHKVVLQLKSDGYLAAQPGRGMVVTAPSLPTVKERLAQIQPSCDRLLQEAADLGLTFDQVLEALQHTRSPARDLLDATPEAGDRAPV
ncbi:GntR family transcriptional regulator [Roseimicrobium sp. ORNL1]|uniref:GntR family transcriptional regulator n=1 Tax=Roseimicrobium sp. ORNL1 TaxID=2711231 RepID=UPI0013E1B953|nr:GntR family transcriptional regulator [Roseimicrobium sp. ORNL1]QIF05586.1 GntR family transcriptional regulator [Roseimicrobium sp. ORNL1]